MALSQRFPRQRLRHRSLSLATECFRMMPREISQNTTSHPMPFSKKNMNPATPMVCNQWERPSMAPKVRAS